MLKVMLSKFIKEAKRYEQKKGKGEKKKNESKEKDDNKKEEVMIGESGDGCETDEEYLEGLIDSGCGKSVMGER